MTAERAGDVRWPIPPDRGYTVDDLVSLDLPPHTELIDGSLVFVSAQRNFHGLITTVLENGLRAAAPDGLSIRREMVVVLSDHTAPEPDVIVVRTDRITGPDQATFRAEDVVLAVEVVSPSSAERDRDTKPHKYAGAGIQYYWRIERDGDRVVALTHELDRASSRYRSTGTFVNQLSVDRPYRVDIDLTEADRL